MNFNPIQVKVPATSANLGAGIDTFGIAFNLYNEFTIQALKEQKLIIEGVNQEFKNRDNLVYTSILKIFEKLKVSPPGFKIIEKNNIPFGKGLGSSASCIIGGLLAGNIIVENKFSKQELFNIAVTIEGHPDNVSPALFGNLTASMMLENETISLVNKVNPIFHFSILIPNFELPTKKAREILPATYKVQDVIYNISHSIVTYESLIEGNTKFLNKALGDKLHQVYRTRLIPDYSLIKKLFDREKIIGSFLSGAGPSIVFITKKDDQEKRNNIRENIKNEFKNWDYRDLEVQENGAIIKILN